eukprot:15466030-Alexandrium_andersonii.AAC.2
MTAAASGAASAVDIVARRAAWETVATASPVALGRLPGPSCADGGVCCVRPSSAMSPPGSSATRASLFGDGTGKRIAASGALITNC